MLIVKQLPEFTDWLDNRKDSMTRKRSFSAATGEHFAKCGLM
jgi:hypothetical protein